MCITIFGLDFKTLIYVSAVAVEAVESNIEAVESNTEGIEYRSSNGGIKRQIEDDYNDEDEDGDHHHKKQRIT